MTLVKKTLIRNARRLLLPPEKCEKQHVLPLFSFPLFRSIYQTTQKFLNIKSIYFITNKSNQIIIKAFCHCRQVQLYIIGKGLRNCVCSCRHRVIYAFQLFKTFLLFQFGPNKNSLNAKLVVCPAHIHTASKSTWKLIRSSIIGKQ